MRDTEGVVFGLNFQNCKQAQKMEVEILNKWYTVGDLGVKKGTNAKKGIASSLFLTSTF